MEIDVEEAIGGGVRGCGVGRRVGMRDSWKENERLREVSKVWKSKLIKSLHNTLVSVLAEKVGRSHKS